MVDVAEIEKIQLNEFKFHILKVLNKYRMLVEVRNGVPVIVRTDHKNRTMDAWFVDDLINNEMRLELQIVVKKNESRKTNKVRSKVCRTDN